MKDQNITSLFFKLVVTINMRKANHIGHRSSSPCFNPISPMLQLKIVFVLQKISCLNLPDRTAPTNFADSEVQIRRKILRSSPRVFGE